MLISIEFLHPLIFFNVTLTLKSLNGMADPSNFGSLLEVGLDNTFP